MRAGDGLAAPRERPRAALIRRLAAACPQVSSGLIILNKDLLSHGFHYPMALSGLGMAFSGVASFLCCKVHHGDLWVKALGVAAGGGADQGVGPHCVRQAACTSHQVKPAVSLSNHPTNAHYLISHLSARGCAHTGLPGGGGEAHGDAALLRS